jgi:hypothetical protein
MTVPPVGSFGEPIVIDDSPPPPLLTKRPRDVSDERACEDEIAAHSARIGRLHQAVARHRAKRERKQCPFILLGLSCADEGVNMREARRKYHSLALVHHPDKGGDARRMADVTDAYKHIERNALDTPGAVCESFK